ncbi:hypothetical protein [Microlunatus speluncae]|uniref:hypothetical protein n=1 Tax=Microlunatus speluncae TaxID=2594267 RepID=UPI0012664EBC|nr:hypothetical protein [Microlunatus speluncae]
MSTVPGPSATSPTTPETPATRRRLRDQQLQRSKLLAVIVVLACVIVATVGLRVSDPGDNFRAVTGELGTMLKVDGVELTISDVRVGQLIADDEEIQSRTAGMFVLLRVQVANPDTLDKYILNHARLLSGKRIYETYGLTNISAEPGYVARADYLFEVDPEKIDGLTLEIWNQGIVSGYHNRAQIHLGITAGNADKWRDAAKNGLIMKQPFTETEVLR